MHVLFLCILVSIVNAKKTLKQVFHSRLQELESKHSDQEVTLKKMKNELESLRFTMTLWSYLNVGLIIMLVYVSWMSYKRQQKYSEWRL